ncbi:Uncharacterised protein [Sphingobacterium multivorum]|jgi:hypothetical protein|uniref:Uncharacterized protein n=1 Tax=Sphingobacterium multivorum TaxID=28454 RepID=A0A654DKC0_SPHMU|nr:Uncharacterised protein [Sphingobacterium multivorum]VXD06409.1 conserved hypothetical protein [Sphingobacterium multivorum]
MRQSQYDVLKIRNYSLTALMNLINSMMTKFKKAGIFCYTGRLFYWFKN